MWLSMPWLAPLFFLTITCIPTWFMMLFSSCMKVWRTVLPVVIWMPCVLFIVVGTVRRSLNNFLDEWLANIFMAVMSVLLTSRWRSITFMAHRRSCVLMMMVFLIVLIIFMAMSILTVPIMAVGFSTPGV